MIDTPILEMIPEDMIIGINKYIIQEQQKQQNTGNLFNTNDMSVNQSRSTPKHINGNSDNNSWHQNSLNENEEE